MLPDQLTSQNLSNSGLWQFSPEFIMGGYFVWGKMFLAESLEFLFCQSFAGLDDDPSFDRFSAVRVRDAAYAHLQNFGMRGDGFFHFARPDLESTRLDELLLAVNDVEIAVFVHAGDITGEQPGLAIFHLAQRVGCFGGHVVIALHHLRTMDDDLADLALLQVRSRHHPG